MSGGQSPDHGSANAEFNQPFSDEQSVPIEVEPPEGPSGAPVNCFLECLAMMRFLVYSILFGAWHGGCQQCITCCEWALQEKERCRVSIASRWLRTGNPAMYNGHVCLYLHWTL